MKTNEIRKLFLDYFKNLDHRIVPSSPVIPYDDPTLLFTNAGMNQFKDVLLGVEKRDYKRAASSQKCIRAGGKHNDLENVGFTARHLTFFEMLGNWSFGDYYKREAIHWAWQFLVDIVKLPKEKLWVSIYKDDDESYNIWHKEIGIAANKIIRLGDIEKGDEENFWSMGPTGPCGPCTEIHYDTGAECKFNNKECCPGCDCDRFLEIWNNVFMEFNRDEHGVLHKLKMKSVDTGMGLERLAAILQNKPTNFDIDIFQPIIKHIQDITGTEYTFNPAPFRVIADHIRCLTFAIADGALPSNEGRGYVLRRILRRGLRFGKKLNIDKPFMYILVDDVCATLGDEYPEIIKRKDHIQKVIKSEEERFLQTLDRGLEIFNKLVDDLKAKNKKIMDGKDAFVLYDTYGFPLDLTELMCREIGLKVDIETFNEEMRKQQETSRSHSKFSANYDVDDLKFNLLENEISEFVGYENESIDTRIIAYRENNNKIEIILKNSPFYAESGGQVGDTGIIKGANYELSVLDTQKINNSNVCICKITKGELEDIRKNNKVSASINSARRANIKKNHTATHLLHSALRKIIGTHIEQAGSYVTDSGFRFDFSHFEKLSDKQISEIEKLINSKIQENLTVNIFHTNINEAKKLGAMALFGEKYGEIVRVVKISDYSLELCGGTHLDATGEIGLLKIISESAIAAGVRRIECVTGLTALDYCNDFAQKFYKAAEILETDVNTVLTKLEKLKNELHRLEKENRELKQRAAAGMTDDYFSKIEAIGAIKFLYLKFNDFDNDQIKIIIDEYKKRENNGIAVIVNISAKKSIAFIGVGKNLIDKYKAGELVKQITNITGGGGGGAPAFSQAGIKNIDKLDEAIKSLKEYLTN